MLRKVNCILLLSLMMLSSCSSQNSTLQTVPFVDLQKYAGKWFEIASYPQRFQKGCEFTTAEYTWSEKGFVMVENRCNRNGKISYIKGKAKVVANSGNAKLKVSFFWPFSGNYWVIDLADDYSYAVVSDPSMEYLWILSRTNVMTSEKLDPILSKLKAKGFDLTKLKYTRQ